MARGRASWRWAALLFASAVPGCLFCGGQTGDCTSAKGDGTYLPCVSSRPLGFDQISSLGYSAADLVTSVGGNRTGALTAAQAGFWQTLGVNPDPTLPLEVKLTVTHGMGTVTENECLHYLSVEVDVLLEIGDGLLERTAAGTLVGTREDAELTVELPTGAGADASARPVTLTVRLRPATFQGELRAGGATSSTATLSGP